MHLHSSYRRSRRKWTGVFAAGSSSRSHPAAVNSKIASSRKRGKVLVEPSESLANCNLDLEELGPRVGLRTLKKVKIRYSYCRNKETLFVSAFSIQLV